jgi:hypothetical protein
MTDLLPNPRCEWKFLAPRLSLAEVLAVVKRHPALFHETYPARVVNNLYLDSAARRDYCDHLNGAPNRTKTRIRWYGPLTGRIERPNLERKIKRGSVSGKTVCPLSPLDVNGSIAPPDLDAALDGPNVPANLRLALRHLEPAVVNRYHRHYFQSADGCFRLTADSGLQFFGLHHGTGWMTPLPSRPVPVIVELKYVPYHAGIAAAITNALPFRLARCSKYVLGIERLLATQPAVSSERRSADYRLEEACLTA